MKPLRAAVLALACALPAVCLAQWMWVDKDGRKVLSDQAPPADVPAKNILRQPGMKRGEVPPQAAASEPAKPVLATAKSGTNKELEEKKKAAENAELEKQKVREAELDKARVENCDRAKRTKATFDSGSRIARTNAKGEREFLDDAQRASETKRLEGIIAKDCNPAG